MTYLAVKVALDPTPRQERILRSNVGAARFAFNWGLARIKANLDQREAEKTYGISDDDLVPYVNWSFFGLVVDWNKAKNEVAPWWKENSKDTYTTGLERLAKGLKNWQNSKNGKRKGPVLGFPDFRSKNNSPVSVRFTNSLSLKNTSGRPPLPRCETKYAVLPKLGRVKLHEEISKKTTSIHILRTVVKFEHGRWFVSFLIDQDIQHSEKTKPDSVVGIDLGIKTLAVLSDGTEFKNPKHLDKSLKKIKHIQRTMARRQGPNKRTHQKASNRYKVAVKQLAKQHAKVYYQRRDSINKMTTDIVKTYGTLVIEDLAVSNMVKNHKLARYIQDASFGEIRRQLTYKTEWSGGNLIVVDRWFPSSKTCSGCGEVRTKLLLSERTYVCTNCGLILDRDANASRNLEQYGRNVIKVAESGSETLNGRGGLVVLDQPAKRQPGMDAQASFQTGTVPTQDGAAKLLVTINGCVLFKEGLVTYG